MQLVDEICVEPELQGKAVLAHIGSDLSQSKIFPTLLLLKGNLGLGKTRFVKSLFSAMGGDESEVQSPTFLKVLEYLGPHDLKFVHADFYRIEDADELEKMGFLESIQNAKIVCVEWPDLIEKLESDSDLGRYILKCRTYELVWKSLGRFELFKK